MHVLRHRLAAFVVVCCVLGACSDDKPSKPASSATTSNVSTGASSAGATSGGATTPEPSAAGDADCTALKDSLASIFINWQVVIGLPNSASAEWAQIPLGTITQFGDQVAVAQAGLGADADAAAALAYMSGANDIVARGLGGDAAAQTDLAAYLGTDAAANIGKQVPISLAYENTGCQ